MCEERYISLWVSSATLETYWSELLTSLTEYQSAIGDGDVPCFSKYHKVTLDSIIPDIYNGLESKIIKNIEECMPETYTLLKAIVKEIEDSVESQFPYTTIRLEGLVFNEKGDFDYFKVSLEDEL